MVSDHIHLPLLDLVLHHVMGSHSQVPEHLVVQEVLLLPGPGVFEKGVFDIEFAKTVGANKKSSSFTTSEVKVFLEVVGSLNSIAGNVGMDLMLRRFPGIVEVRLWLTINSTSAEEWECCWGQKASVGPCIVNESKDFSNLPPG